MLTDVSSDVIQNISSYLIGDPKYVRLNNTEALKSIQKKYKPRTFGLETNMNCRRDNIIEHFYFEIEPKVKSKGYVLDLILKQTEHIKKIIKVI